MNVHSYISIPAAMLLKLPLTLQLFYLFQTTCCSSAGNEKHISCRKKFDPENLPKILFLFFSRLLPETTTKVPTASWATCWAVGMTRACLACRPAVSWAWRRLWTARHRGNTSCWLQPLTQVRPQWRCLSCEGGWYHLEMFERGFYAGLAVLCFSL